MLAALFTENSPEHGKSPRSCARHGMNAGNVSTGTAGDGARWHPEARISVQIPPYLNYWCWPPVLTGAQSGAKMRPTPQYAQSSERMDQVRVARRRRGGSPCGRAGGQGQQPSRGYPRTPLLTFGARLWIPCV